MRPSDVLAAVASSGLPGVDRALPTAPLDEADWLELLEAVNRERLWGLLSDAVATGRLAATERQVERATARHRLAMESVLELEAMTVRTFDELSAAGLDVRLLKGSAIAHLDEVDPSLRCFTDVDLLVRGEDIGAAVGMLAKRAYRRDLPERRPGFDRRFAKEVTLSGPNGREIDLHRTLAVGAFGLMIDPDDLWSSSDVVRLGGRPVPALDAPRRLLHAAYGAVLGDPVPRFVLLRDLGLLLNGTVDHDEARRVAERWGGTAVLAAGVSASAVRFGAEGWPLQDWAAAFEPTRRDARLLAAYRSQGGSNTRVLLSGLAAPIGLGARAAYLGSLVLPAPSYRRARRRAGRPAEVRTGLRELVRRARSGRGRPS